MDVALAIIIVPFAIIFIGGMLSPTEEEEAEVTE